MGLFDHVNYFPLSDDDSIHERCLHVDSSFLEYPSL
jgi:hypothetical protein